MCEYSQKLDAEVREKVAALVRELQTLQNTVLAHEREVARV